MKELMMYSHEPESIVVLMILHCVHQKQISAVVLLATEYPDILLTASTAWLLLQCILYKNSTRPIIKKHK